MDNVEMYWVQNVDDLLTSWAPPSKNKFKEQTPSEQEKHLKEVFTECRGTRDSAGKGIEEVYPFSDFNPNEMIPHHCLAGGGRSGFSVKLISHDYPGIDPQ